MRHRLHFKLVFIVAMLAILSACGSQFDAQRAKLSCQKGLTLLRERVAPEFDKLVSATALPVAPPQKYGCALIFTRILEEMPGEIQGEYISNSANHELAFLMPDYEGRQILTLTSPPSYREGPVILEAKLMEVFGGGSPELIIEEHSPHHLNRSKALRIFLYAEGVPIPKEIFSEPLMIKSGSGRKSTAKWGATVFEDTPAIVLTGGGKRRLHMWNDSLQKYRYDLAATQRSLLSANASAVSPFAKPARTSSTTKTSEVKRSKSTPPQSAARPSQSTSPSALNPTPPSGSSRPALSPTPASAQRKTDTASELAPQMPSPDAQVSPAPERASVTADRSGEEDQGAKQRDDYTFAEPERSSPSEKRARDQAAEPTTESQAPAQKSGEKITTVKELLEGL